jgi:hypothetical protein
MKIMTPRQSARRYSNETCGSCRRRRSHDVLGLKSSARLDNSNGPCPRLILGAAIFLPRSSEDIAELSPRSNAWLSESSVSPRMHLDQDDF